MKMLYTIGCWPVLSLQSHGPWTLQKLWKKRFETKGLTFSVLYLGAERAICSSCCECFYWRPYGNKVSVVIVDLCCIRLICHHHKIKILSLLLSLLLLLLHVKILICLVPVNWLDLFVNIDLYHKVRQQSEMWTKNTYLKHFYV